MRPHRTVGAFDQPTGTGTRMAIPWAASSTVSDAGGSTGAGRVGFGPAEPCHTSTHGTVADEPEEHTKSINRVTTD